MWLEHPDSPGYAEQALPGGWVYSFPSVGTAESVGERTVAMWLRWKDTEQREAGAVLGGRPFPHPVSCAHELGVEDRGITPLPAPALL